MFSAVFRGIQSWESEETALPIPAGLGGGGRALGVLWGSCRSLQPGLACLDLITLEVFSSLTDCVIPWLCRQCRSVSGSQTPLLPCRTLPCPASPPAPGAGSSALARDSWQGRAKGMAQSVRAPGERHEALPSWLCGQ